LALTSAKYFTPSGRLIQRDYSNGAFNITTPTAVPTVPSKDQSVKPSGQESVDTGRAVYGGGGIAG
jgi:carboxyl-terminal processing protease